MNKHIATYLTREGNHTKNIMKLKLELFSEHTEINYPKVAPHLLIQISKVSEFNTRVPNTLIGT